MGVCVPHGPGLSPRKVETGPEQPIHLFVGVLEETLALLLSVLAWAPLD